MAAQISFSVARELGRPAADWKILQLRQWMRQKLCNTMQDSLILRII